MSISDLKKDLFHPRGNNYNSFARFKASTNLGSFDKDIQKVMNHPLTKHALLAHPLPKNYEDLRKSRILPYSNNLEGEFVWILYSVNQSADEINKFLTKKYEFEKSFLLDDYENATTVINNVEDKICKSVWSLENRFLLKEYKEGVEENWSILSKLTEYIENPLILFLIENYSKRAEKKISYFRFKNLFNNQIEDIVGGGEFKEYLCFRLNYPAYLGFNNFSYFLDIESISSVLDRYLLIVDIITEMLGTNDKERIDLAKKVLKHINPSIKDARVLQLKNSLFPARFSELSKDIDYLSFIDDYTCGNFASCINDLPELIEKFPTEISLYEIYVKSLIELDKDYIETGISTLVDKIIYHLFNIYKRNDRNNESTEELQKISLSFFSSNWGKQLFSIVSHQANLNQKNNTHNYLFTINSQYNNPRTLNYIYEIGFDHFKKVKSKFNTHINSITLDVISDIVEGNVEKIESNNKISEKTKRIIPC